MKTVKIIVGVIISITLILLLAIANYGGFTNVNVVQKEEGGEKLVYEKFLGSYDKTGSVAQKIQYQLEKENVVTFKSFGIYYDNPRFVKKDSLHSDVGCILENADTSKTFWLKGKFNIKTCPVKKYISAEFPFKDKMSIMLGVLKVYPALMKFVKDNNFDEKGPIMEIYDMPNHKILYRKEAVKK
ncbi:MAG: GyrI-like domain-containing protein [Paludibacter sp.]